MTLIDFDKKELTDIYSSLQYTRLEIGFENKSEEELYDRLTKLMDKVAKLRQVCDCGGKSNWYIIQHKWGSYYVRWGNQNLYNYL